MKQGFPAIIADVPGRCQTMDLEERSIHLTSLETLTLILGTDSKNNWQHYFAFNISDDFIFK